MKNSFSPCAVLLLLLQFGLNLDSIDAARPSRKGESGYLRRNRPGKKPLSKKIRHGRRITVIPAKLGETVTLTKPFGGVKGRHLSPQGERKLWSTVDETVGLSTASTSFSISKATQTSTAGDDGTVYVVQITPDIVAGNTVTCTATCSSLDDSAMVLNMNFGSIPTTLSDSGSTRANTADEVCSTLTVTHSSSTTQTLYVTLGYQDGATAGVNDDRFSISDGTVTCTSSNTPAPAPTPNPTPSPTDSDATPAPSAAPTASCFSESATVHVQDEEAVTASPLTPPRQVHMKNLNVGQKVFAGYRESTSFGREEKAKTPVYETVYGFGHRNEEKHTEYLQIKTKDTPEQALEISASHLIFVRGKKEPVRADSLQVGDELLHKSITQDTTTPARITKIDRVVRKGMYAPLTKDGTIIVNGLEASTYVSVSELAPQMVEVGRMAFTEHNGFHWYMAPYRFVCTKVAPQLCVNDYDPEEDGINHWVALGKHTMMAGENLPTRLMAIYVALIMMVCGAFHLLDNVLEGDAWSIAAVLATGAAIMAIMKRANSLQKMKLD